MTKDNNNSNNLQVFPPILGTYWVCPKQMAKDNVPLIRVAMDRNDQ